VNDTSAWPPVQPADPKRRVPNLAAERREQLLATRNFQAENGYPIRDRPDTDSRRSGSVRTAHVNGLAL